MRLGQPRENREAPPLQRGELSRQTATWPIPVGSDRAHNKAMMDLLVVGAGLAGLALARDLADAGWSVQLLDKSRGVGGRAATRRIQQDDMNLQIDHGAQFFTARGDRLQQWVQQLQSQGVVAEWGAQTVRWSGGQFQRVPHRHPRYICPAGMSALARALLQGKAPLNFTPQATVTAIESLADGWAVHTQEGRQFEARQLVLNMPAPQALQVAAGSLETQTRLALEAVQFAPCWAALVVLENLADLGWQALEADHPVLAWLALDHTRRAGVSSPVLVLHGQPAWSQTHLDQTPQLALEALLQAASEVLGQPLRPLWSQAHRWRYALPSQPYPGPFLVQDSLAFCGDWCGGARVEAALESGWALARQLRGI
jgi:renalase